MALLVGEVFQSYEELSERIKSYESLHHVQFFHKDSRTLEAAKKRVPKRIEKANSSLMYFSIDLACLFGGKEYTGKGKGARSHKRYIYFINMASCAIIFHFIPIICSTFRQGCPAGVKIRLSEAGLSEAYCYRCMYEP